MEGVSQNCIFNDYQNNKSTKMLQAEMIRNRTIINYKNSRVTNIYRTILNKNYYTDMKSYLRARNNLYEQKLTALPVASITYLDSNNKLLHPTDATDGPQVRKTQNCDTYCSSPTYASTIYKPNNSTFSQQGAVDSSSRIARLKLNTINKNAASFKTTFGTTAPKYMGTSETPYFTKSKYQVCVPPKINGRTLKIKC